MCISIPVVQVEKYNTIIVIYLRSMPYRGFEHWLPRTSSLPVQYNPSSLPVGAHQMLSKPSSFSESNLTSTFMSHHITINLPLGSQSTTTVPNQESQGNGICPLHQSVMSQILPLDTCPFLPSSGDSHILQNSMVLSAES